jgi:hypothetical protein
MKKFLLNALVLALAIASSAFARRPMAEEVAEKASEEVQPQVSSHTIARLKSEINAKERQVRQLVREIGHLKVDLVKAQAAHANQERNKQKRSLSRERARELKSNDLADNDSY